MADLDDFPRSCSLAELLRLAEDLGVPRGEDSEAFRARVAAAWDDPVAIDRAVPDPPKPAGLVLGGLKLG